MMTLLTISNRPRRGATLALALGLLGVSEAGAKPEFPGVVSQHLEMACTPRCTLCHETDTPTAPPKVNTPFLSTLTDNGVVADEDSLIAALDAVAATTPAPDSDSDALADLAELKDVSARDPNIAGPGDICASEVHYGCGAQIAEGPVLPLRLELWAAGAAVGGLLLTWRRRSRPSRC